MTESKPVPTDHELGERFRNLRDRWVELRGHL